MAQTETEPRTTDAKSGPKYLVLKSDGEGGWIAGNTIVAKSSDDAVRAAVGKLSQSEQAGTYVAVPARSWKPVKVQAKVETTLVIEAAS